MGLCRWTVLFPVGCVIVGCVILLSACAPSPEPYGEVLGQVQIADDHFTTRDGQTLPYRLWPANPNPVRGVLITLHGFNDYSYSFDSLGAYLAANQHFSTYAYDQRGFGAAENRGSWAGIDTYVQDLRDFCDLIRQRHPGVPVYVLGESMGGAIAMVAFTSTVPPDADGIILDAPAVWARPTMPWYQRAALWVGARLFPWLSLTGDGVEIVASDNRELLISLGRDPLVIHETKVGAMYGLTNLMDAALASAENLNTPALILIGDLDEIVPNHASALMLSRLPPDPVNERTVVVYSQGYHMLTRDLQGQVVVEDIASWLQAPDQPLPSGEDNLDLEAWIKENLPN